MRRAWKINGVYAKWTLTVAIEPPDPPEDFNVPEWPSERLASVAGHFFEAVNHYELSRDVADMTEFGRRGLS